VSAARRRPPSSPPAPPGPVPDDPAALLREHAVQVVRLEDLRRKVERLAADVTRQATELAELQARIYAQRGDGGPVRPEVREGAANPSPRPSAPLDVQQERDFVAARVARRSDVAPRLRPGLGPVTAGLVALLQRPDVDDR
jgi:hypothetical protein